MQIDNIGKIFMIGDLHYGARSNSTVWLTDMCSFIESFIDDLPKHGFNCETDICMLTGDIFHSREFLNIKTADRVLKVFDKLTGKFKRGVYTILGNHDIYHLRDNSVYSLRMMERIYENLHVFSSPEELTINGKIRFLMLPWNDELDALDAAIANNPGCEYLFSHMDIIDFKYNKSMRISKGVAKDRLSQFKRVYNGHLHHKQEYGNVLCLGTPYQLDLGDMETPRGYYVVSVSDDMLREEYFENEWSPKFVSCMFDDLMEMSFEQAGRVLNKNYAYVHISSSAARNFQLNLFMEVSQRNGMSARRIEFKQYDDAYALDEKQFAATADFNMAAVAKEMLEQKKYSHAETEGILSYFNELYVLAKNNDKENVKS